MAQRVNVVLVDDLDGNEAEETVQFGLDGASYEIDLSSSNAEKLREALAVYVGHARKSGSRSRGKVATRGSSRSSGRAAGEPSPAEIRAWARENGWEVPERGRVSGEVRAAFEAAH